VLVEAGWVVAPGMEAAPGWVMEAAPGWVMAAVPGLVVEAAWVAVEQLVSGMYQLATSQELAARPP
jgi:hypothetical protein